MARKKKEVVDASFEANHFRQIIKEGQFFKSLFEDELFIKKINELQERNYKEWLTQANPEAQNQLWMRHHAMITLLTELKLPIILMEQAEVQLDQLSDI